MKLLNIIKYIYRRPQHRIIQLFSLFFSKELRIENIDDVLIISPHPDDEVFGCGGLIGQLAKLGRRVKIIYLSKGEISLPTDIYSKKEIIDTRRALAIQSNGLLGLHENDLLFLDFPDGCFDRVSASQVKELYTSINLFNPQYIFYPHPYDGSPDHTKATQIVTTILKDKPNIISYYYSVWLWHHMPFYKSFMLDYKHSYCLKYGDIPKKKAMKIYTEAQSERGDFYSGNLPCMLLKALTWEQELFFKVK